MTTGQATRRSPPAVNSRARAADNMEEKQTTCRRNKRKSAEPKRREVLLKRFRSWDSGGSSDEDGERGPAEPVASSSADRPASIDSGCHSATSSEEPVWNASTSIRQSVIVSSSPEAELVETVPDEADDGDKTARPRNYYKSMNRQRRIEANARERTRVHTISAAFESLRRAVPAYADSQKLSKLAILRIASSYILSLACLNDLDYSKDRRQPSFADCVQLCTRTIQAEGKARRRTKVMF